MNIFGKITNFIAFTLLTYSFLYINNFVFQESFNSAIAQQPQYPEYRLAQKSNTQAHLDKKESEQLMNKVEELEPLKTLLIQHEGRIVFEHFSKNYSYDRPVNIKSASKSIISALVGIALREGHLKTLDQPIKDFFPKLPSGESKQKRNITIRDLMLMRSGLKPTSFENYGRWVSSENWLEFALKEPLINPPGEVTDYSTGNSHIVAAILSRATGKDLRDFANEKLFGPLETKIHYWQRSPEGYRFGGNNMALSPRALLRFGQLYLNQGKWQEKQIIPEEWIEKSTASYVFDTYHGYPYGYYWWNANYHDKDVNFAWGHGGQYVFIIPELELVVVTLSNLQSAESDTDNYTETVHRVLVNKIIPAFMKSDRGFLLSVPFILLEGNYPKLVRGRPAHDVLNGPS